MEQTKCLQAKMFGGLQIHVGDRYPVEKGGRVNKPIELLVYLLLNMGTQATNEQIMDALWGEDEVENPDGALKNAAYSLRRLLAKAGLEQECIITRDDRPIRGAYFCPYEVFKHMYHMVVRSATRNSEDVILLLVTLVPLEVPKQEMIRVMLAVKDLIKNMLRKGDVFARYSRNQYVLMLSVKSTDDYKVVRDRLLSRYEKSGLSQDLRMQVAIGIPDPIV